MKVRHTIARVQSITEHGGKHTAHFAGGEGVDVSDAIGNPNLLVGRVMVVCWMTAGRHLWWLSEFKHAIAAADEYAQRIANYDSAQRIREHTD